MTEKAWKHGATFTPKRGSGAIATPTVPTIGALVEPWIELVRKDPDLAPATIAMHEQNARGRITDAFGRLRPEELTTGVLRRWVRSLRDDEKLSASTVRNTFNSLAKMLDCAMAEEWIALAANPLRHPGMRAELPSATPPEIIRVFTREQASKLIRAETTPADRRLRYLVAFTSGMRDGEISALRWSSIGKEQGITVWRVTRNLAHKGPEGFATEKQPKTRASRRVIPIHSAVLASLEAWRKLGWAALIGREPRDEDPVFPGPKGDATRPRSADLLREDLEAAGLPTTHEGAPFEFHDTRHSFATWLASAGVPGDLRDRLLGHSPRTVGERHYTAADVARLRAAVETIRLDLGGPPRQVPPGSGPGQLSQEARSALTNSRKSKQTQILGGVAEWSKAAVLKTDAKQRKGFPWHHRTPCFKGGREGRSMVGPGAWFIS